jgi:hypothetical protein
LLQRSSQPLENPYKQSDLFGPFLQRPLHPFLRLVGKRLMLCFMNRVRVIVNGSFHKPKLLSITPAPTAHQQMQSKSGPFEKWQRTIQLLRLKAGCFSATGE